MNAQNYLNFDNYINYENFYSTYLEKIKISNNQLLALCPFHNDTHPSLSISLTTGQFKCFACGESGNIVSFIEKFLDMSKIDAIKYLCNYAGISLSEPISHHNSVLMEYSKAKALPIDFLNSIGIQSDHNYILTPYYDYHGHLIRYRKRKQLTKTFLWDTHKERGTCLYGLWFIKEFDIQEPLILVEGESDAQTLWLNEIACLGVPGAALFKQEWVEHIKDFKKLYIYIEPGESGETFFNKTVKQLELANFKGEVFTFSLTEHKDPSDAWVSLQNQLQFTNLIKDYLDNASLIDLSTHSKKTISFAPLELNGLLQYDVIKKGIIKYNKDNQGNVVKSLICSTPILISKRVKELYGNTEKVEISYYLDNKWYTSLELRSDIFNTRNIVKLADRGINISSTNSKEIVLFLQALQAANQNTFPISQTVERLGWHGDTFIPFGSNNYIVQQEGELNSIVEALQTKGSLDENISYLYSLINFSPIIRLFVMASCASPFIKDLGQRITCLYVWGPSKGGKTALLKLALSIWGNPDKLMKNFNATERGIEETAALLHHLPLGLNERQHKGADKNTQQLLETIIYMLAEGTGRSKSTKLGGVQKVKDWYNIILANGEVPLLPEYAHAGAHNRCIEIYDKPFSDELVARDVYQQVTKLHGTLGECIVQKVLMEEDYSYILDYLRKQIRYYESTFNEKFPAKNFTHLSFLVTVMCIDIYLSESIFKPKEYLDKDEIIQMYYHIAETLPNVLDYDVTEQFYESTKDWLSTHINQFVNNAYKPSGTILGLVEVTNNTINYYVYQDAFRSFCESKNMSYKQILQSFATKQYITTQFKDGKGRRTVRKSLNGKQESFINFTLDLHD